MKFIDSCTNNKLIVYIIAIAVCLIGIFSVYTMPISPFPALKFNDININLSYPGANAQTVQKQVVNEITTRLQGNIDGLQYFNATAQNSRVLFT
jgi:multidrug efflux pump